MKLGVLASGRLGLQILRELYSIYKIQFVATDSNSYEIISFANGNNISLFKGNPRNGRAFDILGDSCIDVLVSVNYLFLIEQDLISLPARIAINIHGSLLPKYRGRTPHVWAIINGEKESGITVHEITKGCDEGGILEQLIIPIDANMTGGELLNVYQNNYGSLLIKALKGIEENGTRFIVQNEKEATYYGKRNPEDGKINWNWSKERILNWVRAQAYPYPGAFTVYNNSKVIIDKVINSNQGYHFELKNGTIISETPIIVKTSNGALELNVIRKDIKVEINQVFE